MRPSGLIADQLGDTPALATPTARTLPACGRRLPGGQHPPGPPSPASRPRGPPSLRLPGNRAPAPRPWAAPTLPGKSPASCAKKGAAPGRSGPPRLRVPPACVSPSPRPADVWSPPRSAGAPSPRNTAGPRPGGDAATPIPTRAAPAGRFSRGSRGHGRAFLGSLLRPRPCILVNRHAEASTMGAGGGGGQSSRPVGFLV